VQAASILEGSGAQHRALTTAGGSGSTGGSPVPGP
jgi:hypothetical protein